MNESLEKTSPNHIDIIKKISFGRTAKLLFFSAIVSAPFYNYESIYSLWPLISLICVSAALALMSILLKFKVIKSASKWLPDA